MIRHQWLGPPMTFEIALVLGILAISLVLFVTEWVRMDVVSLMVLSSLALTGLVTPEEAISGFSNPAVITVWAMFILSAGLTRAGVSDVIGRNVMRVAGSGEARLIAMVMITAGVLSGFMNNIGVAALMLPVTVDIARRTGVPPSRLLMPLAYGSLLGGLTTLVGTPPNLLISGALTDAGLEGFKLFDFTPLGVLILLVGTAFVSLIGRHWLPTRDPKDRPHTQRDLRAEYGLQARIFALRVAEGSVLDGKTLGASGLSSAAGLLIVALKRRGTTETLPGPGMVLRAGDVLLAQGRLDRFNALREWSGLTIEREAPMLQSLLSDRVELRELQIATQSTLVGTPLQHREFYERYKANVLAIRRAGRVWRTRLSETPLAAGDRLLVQCRTDMLAGLEQPDEFSDVTKVTTAELEEIYKLQDRVFVMRVPKDSELAGVTMSDSRLGDAFDFRLLGIFRDGEVKTMPEPGEQFKGGDLLLIQGREEDLDMLRGLQELAPQPEEAPDLGIFESDRLQMVEATLYPHSALAGKTASELKLRERYEVELMAIWRGGKPHRSELGRMKLQLGDALLFVGPRDKLAALSKDSDFIVLTPVSAQAADTRKAPLASALMLAMVVAVLTGWLPIYIAAIVAATLMVLTRCLTMDQAYRAIEWRSIFLIAGMLPLGVAMYKTGAAAWIAGEMMSMLGRHGPWAVVAGLYGVTALGTMIVPTAALVVLMAPIVLSSSAELGISPHAAMMAVAMAASASFTSPISHPANVLVMGPGGYRFVDYLKLGVPLTLVVFVVVAVFLPLFWPLT